jgi:hypothetical protein
MIPQNAKSFFELRVGATTGGLILTANLIEELKKSMMLLNIQLKKTFATPLSERIFSPPPSPSLQLFD